MAGRKTNTLDEIMAKLPSHLKIVTETYQNTQTYATFVDEQHGEFLAKPHDIINRGRKHPARNKKKGGGNAPPKYQINDIEKKLKEIYGDYVTIVSDSYKGIGENCQFLIEGKEYGSKPSRILKGKLPVDVYLKKLNEKNILSKDEFEEKLKSIRDDVEILEYKENYKKEKSLFKFKNFNKPVRLLGLSILNGALHPLQRAKKALEVYFNENYSLQEIVERCLSISFPYPSYEDKRMFRDYQNLCNQKEYKKNFYTGNSIILNFHKSIYSSHREGQMSPLDAWQNEDTLTRCVKNRSIYSNNLSSVSIARGFEKNRIASRVSVFQPSLARMIIEKYGDHCETVIDPFSGFSGRMLGSTSLGLTYYGFDCRQEVIMESRMVKDFLNLKDVHLDVKNIIDDIYEGQYDLLLTCPPYENKEIWFRDQKNFKIDYYIDLCLNKIKAKKYIFVIDDVKTRYEKYFVDYITNQSHFGKNKEKIIVV